MNERRIPLIYLIIAWLSGIVGLLIGILVEQTWFGRFGSLVVLFALISEYLLLKLELNMLYERLQNNQEAIQFKPSNWHVKKGYAAHITVIVGTLIWGFGDLALQ